MVVKRLCREIQILSRIQHPNVVRLLDVHYEESGNTRSASLLFDACRGGELFDFVNVRALPLLLSPCHPSSQAPLTPRPAPQGIDIMANGDRVWQDLRYGMEHAASAHGLVTEEDLSRIVRQILLAVAYLHEVPRSRVLRPVGSFAPNDPHCRAAAAAPA